MRGLQQLLYTYIILQPYFTIKCKDMEFGKTFINKIINLEKKQFDSPVVVPHNEKPPYIFFFIQVTEQLNKIIFVTGHYVSGY